MTMAYSAQALVEQADATSGGTLALSGLTAGRGLVLTVYLNSTGSAPTTFAASYASGETLTVIGSVQWNSTSTWGVWQAFLPALTATAGNLIYSFVGSNAPTDSSFAIAKEIYDDVVGGIAVDASGGTTGSSTNPTFNVVTTASSNLILGGLSSSAALSRGSGYLDNGSIGWFIGEWSQYQIFSSSGTKAFNWTGATSQWAGAATAFKAAGGGGGFTPVFRRTLSGLGSKVGSRQTHGW